MSLSLWMERVLSEYKKLEAFSSVERAKQIKNEWKNNFDKLEAEIGHGNEQEKKQLPKWHSPQNEEFAICYLKECSPIPRGNKWILMNSNEKCPTDEEYMLHNLPYTSDGDIEFGSDLLKTCNCKIPNNKLYLLKDDMLVELVERLKKYVTLKRKKKFSNFKTVIFKAISHNFYNKLSPKSLINKYDDLVTNKKCSASNELMENHGDISSGKEGFTNLFCTRCFKYCCHQHSNSDSFGPNINTKQYTDNSEITQKPKKPCGNDCFLHIETVDETNDERISSHAGKRRRLLVKIEEEEWQSEDLELFRTLLHIFKENFCVIAKSMMKKNCRQVYELSLKEKTEVFDPIFKSSNKLTKISRATKNRAMYSAHMKTNEVKKLYPFTPCNHSGNSCCQANCVCLRSQNFCEKFCKCRSELCLNQFIGCQCKSNCDTKKCPCYSYGRECDPDLCKSCGVSEIKTNEIRCKNSNIQRGLRKHLLLASSDIAGWGIFLKNGAVRNEFITEYCGEIISQEEANRRGTLYDKVKSSFLFDLNEEFVIDATRMGSKIRFANHSNKPNCYAKVIKVLGDHRIGIYAKRNIKPGEELCFDYKYLPNERLKFLSNNS